MCLLNLETSRMAIKNIIFDLGGVIIDLERNRAINALEKLGVSEAGTLLGEYSQKGIFFFLETGQTSSSDFYDLILPQCRPGTSCSDIRDAFEEFLLDLPLARLKLVESLREKGFKLYVLSNTNPIMFNHWIARAFQQDGKTINDYFDGIVASFQEGVCKPEAAIFEKIILRYNLKPEETLFLDDSSANINEAKNMGLNGYLVTPDQDIVNLDFDKLTL